MIPNSLSNPLRRAQEALPTFTPGRSWPLAGSTVAFPQFHPQSRYKLPKGRESISPSSVPFTCPAHTRHE